MNRFFVLLFCGLLMMPLLSRVEGAVVAEQPLLQSVQATFVQEKHLKILNRPLLSTGTFAFQAPQSLRWEYLKPLHSVLLMHKGRVAKLIEHDDRFEEERGAGVDTMQVVLADMANWLDGRFDDNPLFGASQQEGKIVVLTPKDPGLQAVISRIELHQGEQAGMMEKVVIIEGPDAFTQLTFANTTINQSIPEATFISP